MAAQMPLSEKLVHATTVIDNSGTLSDLEAQVDRVVAKWKHAQGGSTGWWWRLCWVVPPVGLAAGWISLLLTWMRSRKPRRRTRGESERRDEMEMKPLRKRVAE
jgi:dephospho-CoA kinase